mmetsp:Transcript_45514/g.75614  ORF Transcript_45514/g.75614 Transcript_45514/m.75614 type:complete len:222 (-) Transcript_45514:526-1191(-)
MSAFFILVVSLRTLFFSLSCWWCIIFFMFIILCRLFFVCLMTIIIIILISELFIFRSCPVQLAFALIEIELIEQCRHRLFRHLSRGKRDKRTFLVVQQNHTQNLTITLQFVSNQIFIHAPVNAANEQCSYSCIRGRFRQRSILIFVVFAVAILIATSAMHPFLVLVDQLVGHRIIHAIKTILNVLILECVVFLILRWMHMAIWTCIAAIACARHVKRANVR